MKPFTLHDYQQEALDVVLRDKHTLVKAPVGAGKAQPLDSLVLTPNGFTRMGDIRTGDSVVTPDSRVAKVTGVYPQGMRPVYRVTMRDGATALADAEHLWPVRRQSTRMDTRLVTTQQMLEFLNRGTKSSRPYIDYVESLEFGSTWRSIIPPYALGLLLGNGGISTDHIGYSTADDYTVEAIQESLPDGHTIRHKSNYDYVVTTGRGGSPGRNLWLNELRRLGLMGHKSETKFVPKELLVSTKESRLALLQGLLDTDGSPMNKQGNPATSTEYSTASARLADDVAYLARSLGCGVYKRVKGVGGKNYWRLTISSRNGLLLHQTPCKARRMGVRTKYVKQYQAVKSVEYLGDMPTQCIMVDSDEHEYVTDDFLRTHNTLVGVQAWLEAGTGINMVVAPLNTYKGWRSTLKRQGGHDLQFIDSRKAGKEALGNLLRQEPGYYFIGTERFRTLSWKEIHLDFLIVDEVHRGANRKSATYKAFASAAGVEYYVALSATPWGNKVEGAWAVAQALWPRHFDRSFWRWATEYLTELYDPYAYKKFAGEKVPGSIIRAMPSVVQMPSVYNEIPAIHDVEVELNPTQRKVYKELLEDAITFLEENPLIADIPSTKYIRLMETTLATPSVEYVWDDEAGEEKARVYFKDDAKSTKADAVIDILTDLQAEVDEPVLVFTHSRKFATFLTKRLQDKGFEARQFIGGMKADERLWKMENFGKEFSVLVATISTVAEGTDGLQDVCHNEIWCSVMDNRVLNEQGRGRLSRQGQKRKVNRFVIRAKDTIEVTKQHPRLVVDQAILESSYGVD